MANAEKTVLISYRRDSSSYTARAIYQDFRHNGYDVFMNVESVDSGPFDTIILNQIAAKQEKHRAPKKKKAEERPRLSAAATSQAEPTSSTTPEARTW